MTLSLSFLDRPDDPRQLWESVLTYLEQRVRPALFAAYLKGTRGVGFDAARQVLTVEPASPEHVPWIEGRLRQTIEDAVRTLFGGTLRVVLQHVRPAGPEASSGRRGNLFAAGHQFAALTG